MADLADVEDALVSFISGVLYPDGTAASSIVDAECRIYRGWPLPAGLNADLAAGMANVTVFPSSRPGRILAPLPIVYATSAPLPDFTAAATGATATFTGTPTPRHCAGMLVDAATYVYRPRKGDSAGAVAAELARLVSVDRIVHVSGASVTVPGAYNVVARVVADETSAREVRRQEHDIAIACWCPTPLMRDQVAKAIDTVLASTPFLGLSDESSARLRYADTSEYDQAQNALLYRRDLTYSVEYATVTNHSNPAMLFGDLRAGAVEVYV